MVSFASESNAAVTTGWSVTVSGIDFGRSDATPTTGVGMSSCYSSAWVSSTSVACLLTRGTGLTFDALATVSGVVGTLTSAFTFDGKLDFSLSVKEQLLSSLNFTLQGFEARVA